MAIPDPDTSMSDPERTKRTFARDEVESILLEAARLDEEHSAEPSEHALARVTSDQLSMQDIERAAADVGISPAAVATASLRIALRSAHQDAARFHLVHEVRGELGADALDRLVADIRTTVALASIARSVDGIEVRIGKEDDAKGSLLVQIRSQRGSTSIALWSSAPAMTTGDVASSSLLGVPVFLFPVVALAGGNWPAIGATLGLGAAGAAAATAVALAVKQRRIAGWRARVEEIATEIASRVAALTADHIV